MRDAPNRAAVTEIVRDRLGAPLRVVSGSEEAAYAYAGARLAVPAGLAVAVLDVGGASTEIAVGTDGDPAAVSLDLGAVRCTAGGLAADPPDAAAVAALGEHVAARVRDAVGGMPRFERLVGVAGTLTTLAAIDIGRYDPARVHGHTVNTRRIRTLLDRLRALPLARRRAVAGLDPARAPVIVAGAAITLAAAEALGADRIIVSERDLLDGVALEVLGAVDS